MAGLFAEETKLSDGTTVWLCEAGSMQEFLDHCDTGPKIESECASQSRGDSSWAGTASWEEANRIAREGWPEGLAKIEKMTEKIGTVVGMYIKKAEPEYGVSGSFVDVGVYCQGEPECMVSFQENTVRGPGSRIVRISVNISMSSSVDKLLAFHRGAAVVALIDALEKSGMVAEVVATECISNYKDRLLVRVPVKRAGESVELDRMAYIFAHASMLRRHIFAVQEHQDPSIRRKFGLYPGRGYGSPAEQPKATIEEGEIHVEHIHYGNQQPWMTIESATAWVLQQLAAQGVLIEGAEVPA